MARYGSFLYRRNGRYYARLRIPRAFQAVFGKTHLRASLGTADYDHARLRVLETVLSWKQTFLALQKSVDVQQLVVGSALLLGDGLITLESAARECGLSIEELLREATNRRIELRVRAAGWVGTEVPASELQFDHDGSFLPDDSAGDRGQELILGDLYVWRASLAVASGRLESCLFFRDPSRNRAVVLPFPGASVPACELLMLKHDAETMRAALAARVTPAMLEAARRSLPPPVTTATRTAAHKHAGVRASKLLEDFYAFKWPAWSKATQIQMKGMCSPFVELMKDPVLGDIDRAMMRRYRAELLKLPADLYQARRRLKATNLTDLLTASTGLPKMKEQRADAYIGKIGEVFAWAKREGLMPENPAAQLVPRKRSLRREQDERHPFTDENLKLIFSHSWFVSGRGTRTAAGKHWTFQPHSYWLPLLGLFTGGRLNELSQLHLNDVRQTAAGTWYIDFNLDGNDKLDEPDKRLKTINATRQVPLHPELVRLGLPDYVAALKAEGYPRLFPELRFDQVKGYGKQAGQFFNERFLGRRLGIPRDGMQSFHSFRHNFISALTHLDPPVGEFVINHLSGHERGETMSARRYAKDMEPDRLLQHIERLTFPLPVIAPFDIPDGISAIKDALDRKNR